MRAPERGDRETPGQDSRIGVVVEQVEAGGPAAKAGVRVGDVITHYDGQPLDAPVQLAELVGHTPVGRDVELRVRRQRTLLVIQARLEERQVSRVGWMRGGAVAWRGLRLADLSAASRHYVKATGDTGVVVIGVREGSPADRAHLKIGDVIEAVDRTAVREAAAFLPAVRGR